MSKPEYKDEYYEDRINLYDYIQLIWRWKFIIAGIIIVSVIATLLMSFRITPVYRVSASFVPESFVELENDKVKLEPVDSIDAIIAYIKGGNYNPKIFKSLNLDPFGLQFTAKKPGEAYIINVYYDTTDPVQGEVIVRELLNQIEKSYTWKITIKTYKILDNFKDILNRIVFRIKNMKLLKNAEKRIIRRIKTVDDNIESIMKQRDRLLSEGDTVALLFYSNTIQQNIVYKDTLNTAIQMNIEEQGVQQQFLESLERKFNNQYFEMEKIIVKINMIDEFKDLFSKYEYIMEEIPNFKHQLERLKNAKSEEEAVDAKAIRVIQEPFASSKPIKPRRARMVMISVFLSLFLGFFLALITDFIKKNITSSKQT